MCVCVCLATHVDSVDGARCRRRTWIYVRVGHWWRRRRHNRFGFVRRAGPLCGTPPVRRLGPSFSETHDCSLFFSFLVLSCLSFLPRDWLWILVCVCVTLITIQNRKQTQESKSFLVLSETGLRFEPPALQTTWDMFQEMEEENKTCLDDDVEYELLPFSVETINARQVLEEFLRRFCEVQRLASFRSYSQILIYPPPPPLFFPIREEQTRRSGNCCASLSTD